jgi:hypothetical protein
VCVGEREREGEGMRGRERRNETRMMTVRKEEEELKR